MTGTRKYAGRQIDLSQDQDEAMQRGEGPESGHIFGPLALFSNQDKTHSKLDRQRASSDAGLNGDTGSKKADLNGTGAMTNQGSSTLNVSGTPEGHAISPTVRLGSLKSKVSGHEWQHCGDISGMGAPIREKKASYSNFALPHLQRYPLDTASQVKQAEAYFDEHVGGFSPTDRRLFAQSLLHRADELGMKVAGEALGYGGSDYGPFIEAELHSRVSGFAGTGHEAVYEVLLEDWRSVAPPVMADMLKMADHETGADRSYGRPVTGFRDPYAAVYGQPKLAAVQPAKEDTYSWREGGDYVTGQMLKSLASRKADLDTTFGEGFSKSFVKDPVSIFESMPDPQKVVLSRLASDNSSATFRI